MVLQVTGLACGYGEQKVVHDVSIEVATGDFCCILGSNNAGKSTLINCLSGVLPTQVGTIVFGGEDITQLSTFKRVRRGLVQVPEGRQLFPDMTVWENLITGTTGTSKSAASDRELLGQVYELFPLLKDRHQQKAGSLSGGEQQMVAIGRGMMSCPRLLMLDEPSLGLAPMVVESIFQALSELNREGVSVLLVEQNLHTSLQHARYAYVLERGEVVIEGSSDELADNEVARRAYLGM